MDVWGLVANRGYLLLLGGNATPHRDHAPDPPFGKPNLVLSLPWLLVPQVLQAASCSGSAGNPSHPGLSAVGVDWPCRGEGSRH